MILKYRMRRNTIGFLGLEVVTQVSIQAIVHYKRSLEEWLGQGSQITELPPLTSLNTIDILRTKTLCLRLTAITLRCMLVLAAHELNWPVRKTRPQKPCCVPALRIVTTLLPYQVTAHPCIIFLSPLNSSNDPPHPLVPTFSG